MQNTETLLPAIFNRDDWMSLSLPLSLPEDLPFEDWQQIGEQLKRCEQSVMWWIGDWLAFGERNYGEMYKTALEMLDFSYQTLAQAVWVGKKVETSRRRENLSWGHHAEVAALPPAQQDEYLDMAEKESLSVHNLRRKVRDSKNEETREKIKLITPPLGKYRTVVVDPPWPMAKIEREDYPNQVEFPYPVMEMDDI